VTAQELKVAAARRADETEDEMLERVVAEFARAAEMTERHANALLTAAGLELATVSVLLNSGRVAEGWLFVAALLTLGAFVATMVSWRVWVGKDPGLAVTWDKVEETRVEFVIKEFWTAVAGMLVVLPFGIIVVALCALII
jgi:hypothetical protein